MNERIRQIMTQAGYAAPELAERAQKLVDLVLKECYIAIENTNRHHVHTTYDDDLVKHTIQKAKLSVQQHFGDTGDQT